MTDEDFYTEYLRNTASRYGRRDADDVAQDVIVRHLQSGRTLDPTKSPRGYLAASARTRSIDLHLADRRRRAERLAYDPADRKMNPIDGGLVADEVRRCIRQLPAQEREAIKLTYFDGLTHQQAAVAMDVPLGTFATIKRRALAMLRKVIQ